MVFCEYAMKTKFEYDIHFTCIHSWIAYFCKALKRSSITKVLQCTSTGITCQWEILNVCQQAGERKTFMAMVY